MALLNVVSFVSRACRSNDVYGDAQYGSSALRATFREPPKFLDAGTRPAGKALSTRSEHLVIMAEPPVHSRSGDGIPEFRGLGGYHPANGPKRWP